MKTFILQSSRWTFVVPLALMLFFAYAAQAETAPGNGGQLGAQNQQSMNEDTVQQQDRDRLQDGTGDNCLDGDCDGDPDQDRVQTQDRLQDGTGDGDQDRDRVQDQTNVPEGMDPAQARAQQNIRIQTAGELEQYVQEQNRIRAQTQDAAGSQMQTREEARVAADAVVAAELMLGANGPRMSEIAREMNQAYAGMAAREEALQNRGRLQLFLFGQDDEVVAAVQQEMEQNQNRVEEMTQYMRNCEDCDQEVTQMLVTQIQNMEREHSRLQEVANEAAGQRGIFGFLFGWLR